MPASSSPSTIANRSLPSTIQPRTPSTVYHRSGSSTSGSHGEMYARLRMRSAVSSSASSASRRRMESTLEEVLFLRGDAAACRDDAHLAEDRTLGARGDHRIGNALDPHARASARAARVVGQGLD